MMDIKDISSQLLKHHQLFTQTKRPFIVGIDGLGGAGKTIYASEIYHYISQRVPISVIHLDDHIVQRNKRYNTGHPEWYEYYYLQWDIERLTKELFSRLHNNPKEINLPFYSMKDDSITHKKIDVHPQGITIIEGVFLQRNEWREYFDFVIYLTCPFEVRKERVLTRDAYIGDNSEVLDKYKKRYWLAEEYYLKNINPQKRANLVV